MIALAEQERKRRGPANVTFATGNVYTLKFDSASFDVVHAHQLLQHVTRPTAALREMFRVLRPAGVLAVRDGDYGSIVWAPADPRLNRWLEIYHHITKRNRVEADAGRYLLGWVQEAGFTDVRANSSAWTFADPESRTWWGTMWADRVQLSSFADQALAYGLADRDELAAIDDAWKQWMAKPDGFSLF